MRVGIDIQSTVGLKTGIGYYTSRLVERFKSSEGIDFAYYKDDRFQELNTARRMYWENMALPRLLGRGNVDVLHIPGFAGPRMTKNIKKVVTVHDLIGIIYPGNLAPVSRFYWRTWLPACVKSADLIISVSENTKRDMIRLLNIPERKIRVIYSAAHESFRPIQNSQSLREHIKKYGIDSKYILTVSTIEPRKNMVNLIKAFAVYLNSSAGQDISLVIVGKKGWGYNECVKAALEAGLEDNVIFCDYIDEKDLPIIYNLAELFIFPSFYEGFGLPVLEAMSCGTPTICSNTSSLPELTGDAAILIDPLDNAAMTDAINHVLSDEAFRDKLSGKGLERSARFSWDQTAQETVKVYHEAMGVQL